MRIVALCALIAIAFACFSQATLLDVFTGTCPGSTAAYTADFTAGRCYNLPRSNTCNNNTNPACSQVPTAPNRDFANLMQVANCTTFGNSFILNQGSFRYFASANCTGVETSGPLNSPCFQFSFCNATGFGTGAFQNVSPASELAADALNLFL